MRVCGTFLGVDDCLLSPLLLTVSLRMAFILYFTVLKRFRLTLVRWRLATYSFMLLTVIHSECQQPLATNSRRPSAATASSTCSSSVQPFNYGWRLSATADVLYHIVLGCVSFWPTVVRAPFAVLCFRCRLCCAPTAQRKGSQPARQVEFISVSFQTSCGVQVFCGPFLPLLRVEFHFKRVRFQFSCT